MNPSKRNCVLLADRHHGLTEGMRLLLMTTFETVVMVADEVSLLDSAARMDPNIVVIDLALADADGLAMIGRWRVKFPLIRLVVLSLHDDPSVARAVIDAGASAFVLKCTIAADLLDAVDAATHGETYISPSIIGRSEPPEPSGPLNSGNSART